MSPTVLTNEDRSALLAVARTSIAEALGERARAAVEVLGALTLERGAFVSLHTHAGDLRGCVGTFSPRGTLVETVAEMARAAAFDDPRFPPLRAHELATLHVEISVLSPLEPATPEDVKVGVHGLCVQRGVRRGVLLPQVATQEGWDQETFLNHTCIKAGLPAEAWRDPETRVLTFTAEVFGEAKT